MKERPQTPDLKWNKKMRFGELKPYSPKEQAEIKEELERQADEKREGETDVEKLSEELELESREAKKKSEVQRAEKLPEELELESREGKNKTGGEELKSKELEFEELKLAPEKSKEQILAEARQNFAKLELEKADTLKLIKKYKAGKLFNLIKPEDAKIISEYDKQLGKLAERGVASRLMTAEEKQEYEEALSRKQTFERYLTLGGCLGWQIEKMYEDAGVYNKTKGEYLIANDERRVELYEKAVEEMKKSGLSGKKAEKAIKDEMERILNATVVQEAINLDNTKTRLNIEAEGETGFGKIWKAVDKVGNWYSRQPLKYKIMISAGLLGGGFAAGAVGGFAGAALATTAGFGRLGLRIGGGAATAVGFERFWKMGQERHAREKTIKKFGENLTEFIKNNDKILDERLLELAGKKSGEQTRRIAYGVFAGGLVASGLFGGLLRWGVEETGVGKSVKEVIRGALEKFGIGGKPLPGVTLPKGVEPVPGEPVPPAGMEVSQAGGEFVRVPEIAQKGDSVWKIIERQLGERYGEKFSGLDEGRKTYLIDYFKDKVGGNLEKYGLSSVEQIETGKPYDFLPGSSAEVEEGFRAAGAVKERALAEIVNHNRMIEDWARDHPGEKLTSEKVDEILFGEKAEALPEISGEEVNVPESEIPGEEVGAEKEPPGEKVMAGEEPPGEEVSRAAESGPTAESETQTRNVMESNELSQARAVGYTPQEYRTVRSVRINVFLQEFPPRYRAWDVWRTDPYYYQRYDPYSFRHHVRAAEIIRGYHPHDHGVGHMRVGRFFQMYGPRPLRMPLPPPPPFHRPF